MPNSSTHVLIIGVTWPEPGSSAAGSRMMQIIRLFLSEGWVVTFASTAARSTYAVDLEPLGIEQVSVELNSSSFDLFIRELDPAIVVFDRFMTEEQFGWRVAEQCPDALRILDTEDLHFLRKTRRKAVENDRPFRPEAVLGEDLTKREVASILRSDLSLIISEVEREFLQNRLSVDPDLLFYLPYLLDAIDEPERKTWPSFESRKQFVTIGNFRHPPNRDSIEWLHQAIWPRIRQKLPDVEFHAYGAYPPKELSTLHQPENGFHIKGRAEDSKEVVKNARVILSPIRFGAGLKGKLVEAMQCGTPSVTTTIGAEGIAGSYNWPGTIEDDPGRIAEAAVKLYTDSECWHEAQTDGVHIINNRFKGKTFGNRLIGKIQTLRERLENHRLNNITGSILMHHTTASTKYMSKWIEAKNDGEDPQ